MVKSHLQYLRILATIAVIIIHMTAMVISSETYRNNPEGWWISVIANRASFWAVPAFVMISGAVLLGRVVGVADFYRNRAKRLLPAFFVWNSVYLVLFVSFAPGVPVQTRLEDFAVTLSAAPHLWYLPMIFGLLIFAPYLNMLFTQSKPTTAESIFLLLLFALVLSVKQISGAGQILANRSIGWPLQWLEYVPYFLGGYILGTLKISNRVIVFISLLAFCVVAMSVAEMYIAMKQ